MLKKMTLALCLLATPAVAEDFADLLFGRVVTVNACRPHIGEKLYRFNVNLIELAMRREFPEGDLSNMEEYIRQQPPAGVVALLGLNDVNAQFCVEKLNEYDVRMRENR